MNEPASPANLTLSALLANVTRDIDLDLATTIADVLNLYTAALRRNGGRSTLIPDDAIRILHIINSIIAACQGEPEAEVIPGAPTRVKSSPLTASEAP